MVAKPLLPPSEDAGRAGGVHVQQALALHEPPTLSASGQRVVHVPRDHRQDLLGAGSGVVDRDAQVESRSRPLRAGSHSPRMFRCAPPPAPWGRCGRRRMMRSAGHASTSSFSRSADSCMDPTPKARAGRARSRAPALPSSGDAPRESRSRGREPSSRGGYSRTMGIGARARRKAAQRRRWPRPRRRIMGRFSRPPPAAEARGRRRDCPGSRARGGPESRERDAAACRPPACAYFARSPTKSRRSYSDRLK